MSKDKNNFTEEEIRVAKKTKEQILEDRVPALMSIYMAGEICMWDELRNQLPSPQSELTEKELLQIVESRIKTARQYAEKTKPLAVSLIEIIRSHFRSSEKEKANDWISVKDKMPKPISTVLIWTTISTEPTLGYYVNDWLFFEAKGNFWLKNEPHIQVTHWKYLPERPHLNELTKNG